MLCDDGLALAQELIRRGWLSHQAGRTDLAARFLPGPTPVVGGFAHARILKFDREQFVSSGQGGFRVWCPVERRNITAAFVPALRMWRAGGERVLGCGCGAAHDLAALDYQPVCGFSQEWIELTDVGSASLPPDLPDGVRVVLRRG